VQKLRSFGYTIVEPEVGPLASGHVGPGRLADTGRVVRAVVEAIANRPIRQPDQTQRPPQSTPLRPRDLDGWHLVITAGGTAEPIDPVRYIGNRSTGKMGIAIAAAALDRGARVTLVAANVDRPMPPGAEVVRVETTDELGAVLDELVRWPDESAGFDALVMAAAVADFRPVAPAGSKLARANGLSLELESTPDLLAGVSHAVTGLDETGRRINEPVRPRPLLVGFAAETGSLDRAADKLRRKNVDLLVANDVAEDGSGFGTETNRVSILSADGSRDDLPLQAKRDVADQLLDRLARALDERDAAEQTGRTIQPEREPA